MGTPTENRLDEIEARLATIEVFTGMLAGKAVSGDLLREMRDQAVAELHGKAGSGAGPKHSVQARIALLELALGYQNPQTPT